MKNQNPADWPWSLGTPSIPEEVWAMQRLYNMLINSMLDLDTLGLRRIVRELDKRDIECRCGGLIERP